MLRSNGRPRHYVSSNGFLRSDFLFDLFRFALSRRSLAALGIRVGIRRRGRLCDAINFRLNALRAALLFRT